MKGKITKITAKEKTPAVRTKAEFEDGASEYWYDDVYIVVDISSEKHDVLINDLCRFDIGFKCYAIAYLGQNVMEFRNVHPIDDSNIVDDNLQRWKGRGVEIYSEARAFVEQ